MTNENKIRICACCEDEIITTQENRYESRGNYCMDCCIKINKIVEDRVKLKKVKKRITAMEFLRRAAKQLSKEENE